jgi:uncharacterized Zn-binding protein involved in type VI secretion
MPTPGVCRTGDSFAGTCYAHTNPTPFTGTWVLGSPILTANGLSIIRVGDTAPTSCGHTARAIAGSIHTVGGGLALHRQGDAIDVIQGGTGTSTSGSSVITAV